MATVSSVRVDVFTAVTMRFAAFCDVTLCGFVRKEISAEHIATIIRVKIISEMGTMLAISLP
jgi:hypothetical protein